MNGLIKLEVSIAHQLSVSSIIENVQKYEKLIIKVMYK